MTIATERAQKPAITRDRFHRYTFEGTTYPGVTGIIGIVDKSDVLMTWATRQAVSGVLAQLDALPALLANNDRTEVVNMLAKRSSWDRDKAATRGSDIHEHADRINTGSPLGPVAPEHVPQVEAYREWWEGSGWTLRLSEALVIDPGMGYGGTFDLLARDEEGRTVLADLKTGKGIYPEYRLQLAAYGMASLVAPQGSPVTYPMPRIDRYAVLHLTDRMEVVELGITDEDRDAFRACIPLSRWKASHEKKWRAAA